MASREADAALWLHNKLGSTDDLWSGRTICSQLTKERLQEICDCFYNLQAHVKVKLLLSFLHILRRNVIEWKKELDDIILMAVDDRDQWVSTVGEIVKTYPSTLLVNTTDLSGSSTFTAVHSDLRKTVKKSADHVTLPLEAVSLGKTALASAVGQLQNPTKHFTLKHKSKSSSLRQDLLAKSQEIVSNTKKGIPTGSVPMKVRSVAKRMDDEIAGAGSSKNGIGNGPSGFLKANTLSKFTSVQRSNPSIAMRKEGGAKMLDISEMPLTGKEAKRRRKQEEQEAAAQAKKEKEEAAKAAAAAAEAAKAIPTPDYAVGLGSSTQGIKANQPASRTVAPSYLPNVTPRHTAPVQASYNREMPVGLTNPQPAIHQIARPVQHTAISVNNIQGAPRPRLQAAYQIRPPVQAVLPNVMPVQPTPQASQAQTTAVPPQKKSLSLTKEQMMDAQEMFKNSNKVTRPEKALILGFMAGSRDNPCPQQGHVVNIRLAEAQERVALPDNTHRDMISETYFQMNYDTGEWKRIKKFKEIPRI